MIWERGFGEACERQTHVEAQGWGTGAPCEWLRGAGMGLWGSL
jgi:hypothetical protein